jgi:hypothetical protein
VILFLVAPGEMRTPERIRILDMHDEQCPHFVIGEGGCCETCGWWAADEDPLITAERLRQRSAIQDSGSGPFTDDELRQKFIERFGE